MSLDVYLTIPVACRSSTERIYIREDGRTVEISRAEWDERFPDREPVLAVVHDDEAGEVFWRNITHNVGRMAAEAGVYEALWRPDEKGWTKAADLIPALRDGLAELQTFPDRYREFNPENGWGSYEGLVAFVAAYLGACETFPHADVRVSK